MSKKMRIRTARKHVKRYMGLKYVGWCINGKWKKRQGLMNRALRRLGIHYRVWSLSAIKMEDLNVTAIKWASSGIVSPKAVDAARRAEEEEAKGIGGKTY